MYIFFLFLLCIFWVALHDEGLTGMFFQSERSIHVFCCWNTILFW